MAKPNKKQKENYELLKLISSYQRGDNQMIENPPLKNSKDIEETQKTEVLIPEIIKSEVNLLVFPFFALSKKGLKGKTKTEYRDVIKRNGEKLEISWHVTSNTEYGYPTPFDREVHKAVEQIISEILEKENKVKNPIPLGSLYSVCKRMGVSNSGRTKRSIRESLERIVVTSIKSTGSFYSKDQRKWVSDTFHLYERVIFKDEELPDRAIADTNYLFLGSWYLQSLNAFYVKPIDYKYLKSLKSRVASRLYEILGVKFYSIKDKKQPYVWFDYQKLCRLLPITSQKYLSDARRYLEPAHQELVETEFLEKAKWGRHKNDLIVAYYPGERVKKEIKNTDHIEFFEQDQASVRRLLAPQINLEAQDLVSYFQKNHNKLENYQPTKKELRQAQELIDQHGLEKAKYIINYALNKAPETNYKMKYFGAVLNYTEEALKNLEEERLREEQERIKREEVEAKERLQEEEDKKWLTDPQFTEEMQAYLNFQTKKFELKNRCQPTSQEIEKLKEEIVESKKKRLIKKYQL